MPWLGQAIDQVTLLPSVFWSLTLQSFGPPRPAGGMAFEGSAASAGVTHCLMVWAGMFIGIPGICISTLISQSPSRRAWVCAMIPAPIVTIATATNTYRIVILLLEMASIRRLG